MNTGAHVCFTHKVYTQDKNSDDSPVIPYGLLANCPVALGDCGLMGLTLDENKPESMKNPVRQEDGTYQCCEFNGCIRLELFVLGKICLPNDEVKCFPRYIHTSKVVCITGTANQYDGIYLNITDPMKPFYEASPSATGILMGFNLTSGTTTNGNVEMAGF